MPHALLWGAAGGLGRALAKTLTADGWAVHAVARRADGLVGLASQVYEADLGDAFAVQQTALAIGQTAQDFALSIYAAGDIAAQPVSALPPERWRQLLDANLTGAYLTTHFGLPLLAADGHLIFLGANHERLRLPRLAAYAAAKAGLEAFADALRQEPDLRGRRVTVIRPTAVDTPLWRKAPFRLPASALTPEAAALRILEAHTAGRSGLVEL